MTLPLLHGSPAGISDGIRGTNEGSSWIFALPFSADEERRPGSGPVRSRFCFFSSLGRAASDRCWTCSAYAVIDTWASVRSRNEVGVEWSGMSSNEVDETPDVRVRAAMRSWRRRKPKGTHDLVVPVVVVFALLCGGSNGFVFGMVVGKVMGGGVGNLGAFVEDEGEASIGSSCGGGNWSMSGGICAMGERTVGGGSGGHVGDDGWGMSGVLGSD